jgi:hypothetical protein
MPSSRASWGPAAAIAVAAFLGVLGYETARAVTGHDPAIPAATPAATPVATAEPQQQQQQEQEQEQPQQPLPGDALVPPDDPQGPVTRAS